MLIKKTKLGQIGDTITWIVATLVIFAVLFIAVLFTNYSDAFSKKEIPSVKAVDIFAQKSFLSFLNTDEAGETNFKKFINAENLDEVSGKLAQKIFLEFYKTDFSLIWVGFASNERTFKYLPNPYFEMYTIMSGDTFTNIPSYFIERIKLTEQKFIEINFKRK